MEKYCRVFLIVPCIWIFLCACKKRIAGSVRTPFPVNDSFTIKKTYLALGDSYTIGQSVSVADRFPFQTVSLLRAKGIQMQDPDIIAQTGWTTTNLANSINAQNLKGPFSVVSLLIGVNDQFQLRDTTGYRQRFRDLLFTSISLTGGQPGRVFVLSIPDYSVTPFARNYDTTLIRTQIAWFNEINKQVTLENLCSWNNITPYTQQAATDPSLLAADSLHPSGKEYKKWAMDLADKMLPVLQ